MATRTESDAGKHTSRLPGMAALVALACVPALAQQIPSGATQLPSIALPPVIIIGTSPLLGSGVDRDTVPAETNVLRGGDLTRGGTTTPDPVRALNEQVGGVNLDLASGNPYQPTLVFHGFEASALQGTSQGGIVRLRLTGLVRPGRRGPGWRDEQATRPALSPPLPGRADQPRGLAVPRIQPELSGR